MNRSRLRYFVECITRFAPLNLYGWTDHSYEHARRVSHYADQLRRMLQVHRSRFSIPSDFFTSGNLEILEASCWLHDVGNLIGRSVHHWHTHEIVRNQQLARWQRTFMEDAYTGFGIGRPELDRVAILCLAHRRPRTSTDPLTAYFVNIASGMTGKRSPTDSPTWIPQDLAPELRTERVLRLDAAILVLSDALDLSSDRVVLELDTVLRYFWTLYPESHGFTTEYWDQHRKVSPPRFDLHGGRVDIVVRGAMAEVQQVLNALQRDVDYAFGILTQFGINITIEARDLFGSSRTFP